MNVRRPALVPFYYHAYPKLEPSWPLATIVNCRTASRVFRIERVPLVRTNERQNFRQYGAKKKKTQQAYAPEYRLYECVLSIRTRARLRKLALRKPRQKFKHKAVQGKQPRTPYKISSIQRLLSRGVLTTRAEKSSTRFGTADFGATPAKPTSSACMIARPCVSSRSRFASAKSSLACVSFISAVCNTGA